MKKIQLENHQDLKAVINVLERFDLEFTWDMYDHRHLLHLGHVNLDHVKYALSECKVKYKIIDF